MIKMIVAVDRGGAIGWSDGRLPWKLPNDMKRFKELTTGHTVVMGMNTWVSLKRPTGLPNRKNIILTRKPYSEAREFSASAADVDIVSDLECIKQQAERWEDRTFWIIGGASVYAEAIRLGLPKEVYVTLVDANSGGDVTLDLVELQLWLLREEKAGRSWRVTKSEPQLDGELHTSYLTFTKAM